MLKQSKWKTGVLFFAALLAALTATAAAMQQEQQALAGKLIRLHVVAHSDRKEDQQRKLLVRDAVLAVTQGAQNEQELAALLPQIRQAAVRCLRENGCDQPVTVSFGSERFPTRAYDNFSLPAGVYRSLRVVIGDGAGHNWWCVVFPSICFRATAAEVEQAAQVAGLTAGEVRLITEETAEYQLKFKSLELLAALKTRLFGKTEK